jgi:hypothetical protein
VLRVLSFMTQHPEGVSARDGRFLAVLGLSTSSRTFEAEVEGHVRAVREVAATVTGDHVRPAPRDDFRAGDVRRRRAA